jgi:hypothetical protein
VDDDARARIGKCEGSCAPDAARCTGDERGFVGIVSHNICVGEKRVGTVSPLSAMIFPFIC